MEIKEQPKLRFNGVDFIHVSFDAAKEYDRESNVNIRIEPSVFYPNNSPNLFNILMDVSLSSESFFNMKISAVGYFELEEELSDQERRGCVNANAPAIMFPYIRSFISTLTANLGNVIELLRIPTQFFRGEIKEIIVPDNKGQSI